MPTRIARGLRTLMFAAACITLAGAPASAQVDDRAPSAPPRPAALVPLYVSFAGLNALDVESTYRVLGDGGAEANPVAARLVHSPAALIAFKAGSAAAAIAVTERLRRRNPKTAVVLMVTFNSMMATIVAHNYAVATRAGR
jgi:hypothetical protein